MPEYAVQFWRFTGHAWLPLAGFLLTLLLGAYVLLQNPWSRLHRIFALLNVAAALWNLDVFLLFTIQDGEIAGAVDRLFQPAVLSLLFLALLFIYVFLGKKPTHPVLLVFGAWTLALMLISPYDVFIAGWERHWYGFYGRAGEWYVLFPLMQVAYLVFSVPPLLAESRRATEERRRSQAFFLLLANLAFGVLSIDNFMPLYGGGRMPAGNLAAVVYFFLVAATMVRHRLLDVAVVLRYGLLYSMLTFTLSGAYLLLVLGLQSWFHAEVFSNSLLLPMLPALLLAVAVVPLKNGIQGWIDMRIFPVRAKMRTLLSELPSLLSGVDVEDRAWRTCWEKGWRIVNPRWATLEIGNGGSPRSLVLKERGSGSFPVLTIPVGGDDGLLGTCCFGEKANGVSYGEEEVLFLRGVAAQCALAVDRARLAAENRRRERLAALGRAAAVVSHELRNPLNVIKGAARLLRSRLDSDDAAPIIAMVEDEIRRGDRFINDFLSACRVSSPRRAAVDMQGFVEDFAEHCRLGEGLPADITVIPAKEAAVAQVDPFQMRQVFENLIRNAVEAAGGRAAVTIACFREKGGLVRLSVSDGGPGIPPEILSSLFEPFQTSRRNGTGLGLSIVKGIVEAHGGRVGARNGREGGAHFDIRLPGVSPATEPPVPVITKCMDPKKGES